MKDRERERDWDVERAWLNRLISESKSNQLILATTDSLDHIESLSRVFLSYKKLALIAN